MELPAGQFAASWFNPRTGKMSGQPLIAGGPAQRFTAPDLEDWVLHVVHERIR
jgi:hypothetical protein